MALTTEQFAEALADTGPEARTIVNEHLEDNDELLIHLLVARMRDLAIESFDSGRRDLASRLVDVFDLALGEGDEKVQNAVQVSFVEDTPWWDANRQAFIASWPERMRAVADEWRSESEARRRDDE